MRNISISETGSYSKKIVFHNKTIIANEDADWERDAVKKQVISKSQCSYKT